MNLESYVAPLITAGAALVTGWLAFRQRGKETSTTREALLIDQLQEEVTRLRQANALRDREHETHYTKIQIMEAEVAGLRTGLQVLTAQLVANGLVPRYPDARETG